MEEKIITLDNASTDKEFAALIYSHKKESFQDFMVSVEKILKKHKDFNKKRFKAATAAMQGILSNTNYTRCLASNIWKPAENEVSKLAFEMADELIKQENENI